MSISGRVPSALTAAVACLAFAVLAPAVCLASPPSPHLEELAKRDPAVRRVVDNYLTAKPAGLDQPTTAGDILMARSSSLLTGSLSVAQLGSIDPAPAAGVYRQLVLLVDFSDKPRRAVASSYDDLIFKDTVGPSSVRGYYREVSAGALDIQAVVGDLPSSVGWLRMPRPYSYYCNGTSGIDSPYPNNGQKLAEDAMAAAKVAGVDFSSYDNNHDGALDSVIIVHSGTGAERTGSPDDIWSHMWGVRSAIRYDGVLTGSYTMQPEYWSAPGDMTTGVFCHELGHVFGLPDLYDTDQTSRGIGNWSLMASGSWNGGLGGTPSRPDAWCEAKLGFASPIRVSDTNAQLTIRAASASSAGDIYRIEKSGVTGGKEYFLVENRQRTGTDAALPGAGLLIWHIDETQSGNSNEARYKVDLEEAHGGIQNLSANGNYGDSGDPFRGTTGKTTFSDLTDPGSAYYDGSGRVLVERIGASSATMTARVSLDRVAPDSTPPSTVSDAREAYDGAATITLTATDVGYGVAVTDWSLDGAAGSGPTVIVSTWGPHVLSFWSVDVVGNVEERTVVSFVVRDVTAPVATSDVKASYTGSAEIALGAQDSPGGSGVAHVYYRLDGGLQIERRQLLVLPPLSGTQGHVLEFWSVDAAGNADAPHKTAGFSVRPLPDTVDPTTTSDALAFYAGPAHITLTASDGEGGSGVAWTYYVLDNGQPVQVAGGAVALDVSAGGEHALAYRSIDEEGNGEATRTATFVVDGVAPVTRSDAHATYTGSATIKLTGVDNDGGSGVAHTWARLDTGQPVEGTMVKVNAAGAHTLTFWCVDRAGTPGAPVTVAFTVSVPFATLPRPQAPTSVHHGRAFTVTGYLKPRHPSGSAAIRLRCYRKESGHYVWHKTVTVRVSDHSGYSQYSARLSLPSKGTWRIRAYHSDSGHRASYSGYDYVAVR